MQDHDALTFMYPEKDENKVIPILQKTLVEDLPLAHGRVLRIPYDCKVGWNKGEYSEANPDGLKDFYGEDKRSRTPQVPLLDRIFR